jgi:hypothetical protein
MSVVALQVCMFLIFKVNTVMIWILDQPDCSMRPTYNPTERAKVHEFIRHNPFVISPRTHGQHLAARHKSHHPPMYRKLMQEN